MTGDWRPADSFSDPWRPVDVRPLADPPPIPQRAGLGPAECVDCGRATLAAPGVTVPRCETDLRAHSEARPAFLLPAPAPFRTLVTGSRTWGDPAFIWTKLDALHQQYGARLIVMHGDNPKGVDAFADLWCKRAGVLVERRPADWTTGRGAGHARNAAMVATRPDLVLAFIRDGSPGASGCLRMARAAGLATERYDYADRSQSSAPAEVAPDRDKIIILERSRPVEDDDERVPSSARQLAARAVAAGRHVELTAALARNEETGQDIHSLCTVVWTAPLTAGGRRFGHASWVNGKPTGATLWQAEDGGPRRTGVTEFAALAAGETWIPPTPAPVGPCPACARPVRWTKDGKPYGHNRPETKDRCTDT
jgi:hypothetical protein